MTNLRWALILVAVAIVGSAIVVLVNGYHEKRYQEKSTEAAIHAAKSDVLVSVGRQKDVQIASQTSDLAKAEKDIERLKAEYAKLRKPRKSLAQFGTSAGADGVSGEQPGDLALDAADAVISAQDGLIAEQAAQIADLTVSRDAWKSAFEAKDKEAVALRIALDAQKHAAKSGKWLGRIQGFAVGIGVGYVGGKLR